MRTVREAGRRLGRLPGAGLTPARDAGEQVSSRGPWALTVAVAVGLSAGVLATAVVLATAPRQIGAATPTSDLVTVSVEPGADESTVLPPDTEERLARTELVTHSGRRLDLSRVADPVVTRLPGTPLAPGEIGTTPQVVATTAGYLRAAATEGPAERFFHLDGDLPVAFLGREAARAMDVPVTDDPTGLQVWIDGLPYDVVGYLGEEGPAGLGDAVVVPYARGLAAAGGDAGATVLIRSLPDAGTRMAEIAARTIRPDDPDRLETAVVHPG